MSIERKVLVKVLRQISKNETPTAAPDDEYLKALQTIGLVKLGWDNSITELGRSIMNTFDT